MSRVQRGVEEICCRAVESSKNVHSRSMMRKQSQQVRSGHGSPASSLVSPLDPLGWSIWPTGTRPDSTVIFVDSFTLPTSCKGSPYSSVLKLLPVCDVCFLYIAGT